MHGFLEITKALSDENRVRALMALRSRELCACQIIELLGLAPSTVSKHMAILKQARLVESRKNGRWIYYRLADNDVPSTVSETIEWVFRQLSNNATTCQDTKHLKEILKQKPLELCKRQRGNENSSKQGDLIRVNTG